MHLSRLRHTAKALAAVEDRLQQRSAALGRAATLRHRQERRARLVVLVHVFPRRMRRACVGARSQRSKM